MIRRGGDRYVDGAKELVRRFLEEELPRHRRNVRTDDGTFKITPRILRSYFARYVGGNDDIARSMIISIYSGGLRVMLEELGYEILYSHKGVIIIRKRG